MIGLYFEGTTPCAACGKPIPLNALVEDFVCTECLTVNKISVRQWKELLEDMFKEAPHFEENEGQPSNVFGERTYSIVYGRQNPKFKDSKTYIDMEKAIATAETGKVINPASHQVYSIRRMPENMKEVCPYVSYLVCEDSNLLSMHGENQAFFKEKTEPVAFSCPTCAGSLKTDGSARKLKCHYCSNEVFIPDTVWQKMHPSQTKQAFYFWYDEKSVLFSWESALYDCVTDEKGNLYLSLEPEFSSDEDLWIVALNPNLTIKWKRDKLKFKTTTGGGEARLGLNAEGELMVWSSDRSAMLLLSTEDGSELRRIGKKSEIEDTSDGQILDFKKCLFIAALPSGGYFAYIERKVKGADQGYQFVRLDKEARISAPWADTAPKGFFGFMKSLFSSMSDVPYIEGLRSHPTQCKDRDIAISIGLDGSFYLQEYEDVIKLDAAGRFVYHHKVGGGSLQHRIFGDKEGNAYYLIDEQGRDTNCLVKVDAMGHLVAQHIASVLDNGLLAEEDMLAMSANGTIYCTGYGGMMRIFNAKRELVFVSDTSLEDEKELKEKDDDE